MTLKKRIETAWREPTDNGLLEKARQGDETAFVSLYERHRDGVFRFAYRLVSSVAVAEDITQDCFLSLIKNPDRFEGSRASLRTYLLGAARNLSLKRFGRATDEAELDSSDLVSSDASPLRKVLDAELSTVVQRAVEGLPPLQREALVLFEFEELTLAQIADVVSADVGTVKGRLHRARRRLKSVLSPYYREGAFESAPHEVLK